MSQQQQRALLAEFEVSYVVHSSLDDSAGKALLDQSPYLLAVFSEGGTTVYQVQGVR
jgi:hypothetical protein